MPGPEWDKIAEDADETPGAVLASAIGKLEAYGPAIALVVGFAFEDGSIYTDYTGHLSANRGLLAFLEERMLQDYRDSPPHEE